MPHRRFFTTNDPVLTPAMMDHFFNRRTQVFATLNDRQRLLLRSIYDRAEYRAVLPAPSQGADELVSLRQHQRFSIRCPARLMFLSVNKASSATNKFRSSLLNRICPYCAGNP